MGGNVNWGSPLFASLDTLLLKGKNLPSLAKQLEFLPTVFNFILKSRNCDVQSCMAIMCMLEFWLMHPTVMIQG